MIRNIFCLGKNNLIHPFVSWLSQSKIELSNGLGGRTLTLSSVKVIVFLAIQTLYV